MRGSYSDGLVTRKPGFGSAVKKIRFFAYLFDDQTKQKKLEKIPNFRLNLKVYYSKIRWFWVHPICH